MPSNSVFSNLNVPEDIRSVVTKARDAAIRAQRDWRLVDAGTRFGAVSQVAAVLAERSGELIAANNRPATAAEIVASEIFPLADACKFAAKHGPKILAPSSHHSLLGSWWMGRIGVTVRRDPWGLVLILAPGNYPLLLPGVQIVQALAAGNGILVKPSPGCEGVMELFRECLASAGVPIDLVQVLPSEIVAGEIAMELGVDKVVLTGSVGTGRAVLRRLVETLTPSTMELSGCDAVFVMPGAELKRAALSIAYALSMNGGATCIAPRRIFVTPENKTSLSELLTAQLQGFKRVSLRPHILNQARELVLEAVAGGAKILLGLDLDQAAELNENQFAITILTDVQPHMRIARTDVFAPLSSVIQVADMAQAVQADSLCSYHLGASVFGPVPQASLLAEQIHAGCVTINDVLVPTADPRVAFGGRDHSGWGVTRGPEGLLEMTRPKVICTRRGRWLPHLNRDVADNATVMTELLKMFHARTLSQRVRAAISIMHSQKK